MRFISWNITVHNWLCWLRVLFRPHITSSRTYLHSLRLMLFGYTYFIFRLLDTGASELLHSRWVSFVKVLRTIKATEEKYFTSSFSIVERYNLYLENESIEQGRFIREFIKYVINAAISLCVETFSTIFTLFIVLYEPVNFIIKRCCSAFIAEEKKEESPITVVAVDSYGHKHEHNHLERDHHDQIHIKTGAELLLDAALDTALKVLPVNRVKLFIRSLNHSIHFFLTGLLTHFFARLGRLKNVSVVRFRNVPSI